MEGVTINLLLQSLVLWLGSSFPFGWNMAVLNQPSLLIQKFYNDVYTERNEKEPSVLMLNFLWSFTNAVFYVSGMCGAMLSSSIADRVGRKKGVMISNVPAFIGAVIQTVSVATKLPELLIIGRTIQGFSCGLASTMVPLYLLEIAPYKLRGTFGFGHQGFITVGMLTTSIIGLSHLLGVDSLWQYLLLLNIVPAFISVVGLLFLPDSPRYLLLYKNDKLNAIKALQFLRKCHDVSEDIAEMEKEQQETNEAKKEKFTIKKLIMTRHLRIPLLVACGVQITQQATCISGILFYSVGIYIAAGVAEYNVPYAVVGTFAVLTIGTFIGMFVTDRVGRRPLLTYPLIIIIFDLAALTTTLHYQEQYSWMNYGSIALVLIFMAAFSVGLGPIPPIIGTELFRQGPRALALSIAGATVWICIGLTVFTFELIQEELGEFTLLIFMTLSIACLIFVYFMVPETRHRTFEEIAKTFYAQPKLHVSPSRKELINKNSLRMDTVEIVK